jgi:hypothetical protein
MKAIAKKYAYAIMIFAGTALFVVIGTLFAAQMHVVYMTTGASPDALSPAPNASEAVKRLYENVQRRSWPDAYRFVANQQDVSPAAFTRSVDGADGSLRTFSALSDFSQMTLNKSPKEATVRVDLQWSTAVGAFYERKELKVISTNAGWKVTWPVDKQAKVPPQVVAVTYPRWDVWTPPGTEPKRPNVRITSQSATQDADTFIVVGEITNDDSVPAFVNVTGQVVNDKGETSLEESSFDFMSHTLLPKQTTPFRIEFPSTQRSQVKNVKLALSVEAVSASADPVVKVLNPHIETTGEGQKTLVGEIVSESGLNVNIPHVLATFTDQSGKVVWVAGTYLDSTLFPQTPLKFAMKIPQSVVKDVTGYKVTVNAFRMEKS